MMSAKKLLLLGFVILGLGGHSAYAQDNMTANSTPGAPGSYTVDKGPVTLYGQTLNPYTAFYESGENTGPRWDDIRYLVPEMFPDARKGTLTPVQFCDFLYNISKKYAAKEEVNVSFIAYALAPHFPDIEDEPSLVDQASLRLHSRDEKDLVFLLEKLPDMQTEIMMSKEWTMKTKVSIMLFDAAIEQTCPDHARQMGYQMYSASYYITE